MAEVKLTAEQTVEAMKNARRDRLRMSQDLIGVDLEVKDVEEIKWTDSEGKDQKSFNVIVQDPSGRKHPFPFSYYRDGRVVTKTGLKGKKEMDPFKNVFLESEAVDLTNNSELVSKAQRIEAGEDYTFPAKIRIKAVVVPQHPRTKEPLRTLRSYKGVDIIVGAYQAAGKPYPNLTQCEQEIKNYGPDRIPELPKTIDTLQVSESVSDSDLHTYRMGLIFEDLK